MAIKTPPKRKNSPSQCGLFNSRALLAFALCSVGAFLAMLSLAAPTAPSPLPSGGSFAAVGAMIEARYFHTATLLGNGKVLITGGYTTINGGTTNATELFDPASGTFTPLSPTTMTSPRSQHTATLLPNGEVLIAGGQTGSAATNTAELFDPASANFTSLSPMTSARHSHTATLLTNGKVLITGGYTGNVFTKTAELSTQLRGLSCRFLP
jgi:hypothetical protein